MKCITTLVSSYNEIFSIFLYFIPLDNSPLSHIFKCQIVSLAIDIGTSRKQNVTSNMNTHLLTLEMNTHLLTQIFTMFTNLQCLKLAHFSIRHHQLTFDMSSSTILSSYLLELHVNLYYFTDCLYLLDGRFNQLRTLYVNIEVIIPSRLVVNNQVNNFM
jgi:hypothetical protein